MNNIKNITVYYKGRSPKECKYFILIKTDKTTISFYGENTKCYIENKVINNSTMYHKVYKLEDYVRIKKMKQYNYLKDLEKDYKKYINYKNIDEFEKIINLNSIDKVYEKNLKIKIKERKKEIKIQIKDINKNIESYNNLSF